MLYKRIVEEGTINEPEGKPNPQFALPSTVNWMRGLRLLVEAGPVDFATSTAFYSGVGRRNMAPLVENTVFEQLFLGLHQLAALERMADCSPAADVARVAVVAWYYGITNGASAMIAAQNGSFQEDHAGTARMWDSDIAARGLSMEPFSWRVSSLVEKDYKSEVDAYRGSATSNLQVKPTSVDEAHAAAAAYLSGSAKWHAWKGEEDVRRSKEFKLLGVDNFRTKAARELRDALFANRAMGFVHQASRYRGKANYREALFLAYGRSTETMLQGFVADQAVVLKGFLSMAGAFAARKFGHGLWNAFVTDIEANRAFSADPRVVWP